MRIKYILTSLGLLLIISSSSHLYSQSHTFNDLNTRMKKLYKEYNGALDFVQKENIPQFIDTLFHEIYFENWNVNRISNHSDDYVKFKSEFDLGKDIDIVILPLSKYHDLFRNYGIEISDKGKGNGYYKVREAYYIQASKTYGNNNSNIFLIVPKSKKDELYKIREGKTFSFTIKGIIRLIYNVDPYHGFDLTAILNEVK